MTTIRRCSLIVLAVWVSAAGATEPRVLQVPEGFAVELVAGSPLVERPITAAFDEEGRLYVADSSGSNDPVEKQLEERPHRIVRLEDTDADGRFDKSIVFADRMMFPEGTMFYDGSLYVAAPPSIWKLTDTDGDGVADRREEWFQGKTLTGCANDLHGPYLGPDGWIYWCKGAFAEQTHVVRGREWTTRAAHLFRCRPDGTELEPVITGGMDNPVDVAFTPDGEPILSATFLVHPGGGARDGLIHAVYGGVFGKEHGVLDGHARTGKLMPILVHLGAAAPCGLERYDSAIFGEDYRDNFFCCEFNHRKVSRHRLEPEGSTFRAETTPFVTSHDVDFHPTDVLTDADGSLLVVDTGGWYKLCCPTSQLWKPEMLGGIYRVKKLAAQPPHDPRGLQLAWNELDAAQLWHLLSDDRPAVRERASRELATHRESPELQRFLVDLARRDAKATAPTSRALDETWALVRIDTPESRALVRRALSHRDESVRRVALHGVSLHRDGLATDRLLEIVQNDTPGNRRVAAEALGRIGDEAAVPALLQATSTTEDRAFHHTICYALVALGEPIATRDGLSHASDKVKAAAILALDQMPDGIAPPVDVIRLLDSPDEMARDSALWIAGRHPEWGADLAAWLERQLHEVSSTDSSSKLIEDLLVDFTGAKAIQELVAIAVTGPQWSIDARIVALHAMSRSRPSPPPEIWIDALAKSIETADPQLLPTALQTARALPATKPRAQKLDLALSRVVEDSSIPAELRVEALAAIAPGMPELSEVNFNLLLKSLEAEAPLPTRSAAADALSQATLTPAQLERLCTAIEWTGPLELHKLIVPFGRATNERLALKLLESLKKSASIAALRIDLVREVLAKESLTVQQAIDELHARVNVDLAAQRKKLAELLPKMSGGNVRRGHAVFHSAKAACTACHQMGYAGGRVGPDLSRIGETRTDRDLLEAILFPSLSFVRSYEPSIVLTVDGRGINGVVRDEGSQGLFVATGPDQELRIPRDEVEEVHPSNVSVMPAGLDQQLTLQELADLIAFLKAARGS